jgi:sarcosine oxidase
MNRYDIVVVGIGAVGASTLYQLSFTGKKILGIDRFDPPHTHGSSHGETRITRLAVGEGADYVSLAKRSHEIWKELEAKTGHQIYTPVGGILMDSGLEPWGKHGVNGFFERTAKFAQEFGVKHERWDPIQLQNHYSHFQLPNSGKAYFEYEAGYLKPELAIQIQLDQARSNGAEILVNNPVMGIEQAKGGGLKIRLADQEIFAEKVLISSGGWVKDFLSEEEKKSFKICRQVLHWVKTQAEDWKNYPVFMWGIGSQPEDFIYGFPSLDAQSIKIATESFIEIAHPSQLNREVSEDEQRVFWEEKIEGRIKGLTPKILKSTVCFYTMTEDSKFVIKPISGLEGALFVSACSGHGFKHSAALGEVLKDRLLDVC